MFTAQMLAHIIRFYGNAMQGMMGAYLEKNIQAFIEIQAKLKEQSKAFYDGKGFGPEMWTQFINGQAPMIQTMMSNYIEQSKNLFMQMQDQMQNQTRSVFGQFPFPAPGKEEVARRSGALSSRVVKFVLLGSPGAALSLFWKQHECSSPRRLRVPRLPQGPGRFRAHPDPTEGRGLSDRRRITRVLIWLSSIPAVSSTRRCRSRSMPSARHLAENGKVIVNRLPGCQEKARAAATSSREVHPKVLAVTGPHALGEVMQAVHTHLPQTA